VADSDTTNDTPWRTALYAERRWNTEWSVFSKASPEYVPPWEAVREQNLVYIRYGDDPWTEEEDSGFVEFYDLSADPHQLRNLAYYHEVPQATLDRMQSRLLSLRGCSGPDCRTAEDERCTITGTPANDTLTGTSGADVICALGGNDTLYGGGGGDVITGMGGDDALRGDSGADKLKGDLGNDSLNSRDGVNGNDFLDGGSGTDTKVTDATEKSIVGFP
jgi:Ca2+-binding RTX toxin-like protein